MTNSKIATSQKYITKKSSVCGHILQKGSVRP